jgi:beta-glucuronidase
LFDEGLRQRWYALDETPPSQWSTPRDYEVDGGDLVPVPSCWNLLKPEWFYFEGSAWYTRDFDGPALPAGERIVLQIGAANYLTRVFLNGRLVGGHRGGSTPFSLDVTEALAVGRNRLQVQVENRRAPDRVPMHHFDWFNYGGLYREVSLLALPAVHIRDFGVALVPDGTFSRIRIDVELSAAVDITATFTLNELGVEVHINVVAGRGSANISAQPVLWSPAQPRLYDVVLSLGTDSVRDRVGFREIRVDGERILLNGSPIYLKGVCVHEDDAALAKVSTEADVRRRFADARELGCNFLRLAHYPHHEHVARIADELGFLLWAEVPVYWAIDFDSPATYADAENQLRELIRRDRNRASVIIWGVGNENADTDARYRFMASLAETARRADTTRFISAACLINRETFRIEDRLADHLDLIGLNEYFGWYEPDLSGLEQLLANSTPGKPVIISETGADAMPGHRAAGRVLFGEDWQAEFYRRQFDVLDRHAYVQGVAAWLLYDFRSARRQTTMQRGLNRKGLIAEDKITRKLAFQHLAELNRHGRRSTSG